MISEYWSLERVCNLMEKQRETICLNPKDLWCNGWFTGDDDETQIYLSTIDVAYLNTMHHHLPRLINMVRKVNELMEVAEKRSEDNWQQLQQIWDGDPDEISKNPAVVRVDELEKILSE